MTSKEFEDKEREILKRIPVEFHGGDFILRPARGRRLRTKRLDSCGRLSGRP
jgi:hypothetical protein